MALSLDRLVRKEVSLGSIREKQPPMDHIGLAQIAPFLSVGTDDVIFDYIEGGLQDGLAPQRAEDAEAELAQKDDLRYGQGRAAVIDWALKNKYTASDVQRYREDLFIQEQLQGLNSMNSGLDLNFIGTSISKFQNRIARDDARRRRFLDNRIEWMIMSAVENSSIAYNDGKIKWTVNYGRPSDQTNVAPPGGLYNSTTHDPINDIDWLLQRQYDRYGVRPTRVVTSRKVLNTFWKADKFVAKNAIVVGGTPSSPIDPRYLSPGFDKQAAVTAVEQACGVRFIVYDSVWQTRVRGTKQTVNNRFLSENKMFFLPEDGQVDSTAPWGEIDATEIGFAKTLTSPHPEGNWQSGFYEWEVPPTQDPWMQVRGSGIKAFPVFPYMELTASMTVL